MPQASVCDLKTRAEFRRDEKTKTIALIFDFKTLESSHGEFQPQSEIMFRSMQSLIHVSPSYWS